MGKDLDKPNPPEGSAVSSPPQRGMKNAFSFGAAASTAAAAALFPLRASPFPCGLALALTVQQSKAGEWGQGPFPMLVTAPL